MGLFTKKNKVERPAIADSIKILPEYYFKLDGVEYHLGMKFSCLKEFAFTTEWQELEKIKPKETYRTLLKHKKTGQYVIFYLVNRSDKKCKIFDSTIYGIEFKPNETANESVQYEFFYKPGPKKFLHYHDKMILVNILGQPLQMVEGKWTVEKQEYLKDVEYTEQVELEFDYDYTLLEYKIRTTIDKVMDVDVYEHPYFVWHKGDAVITASYDPASLVGIEKLSMMLMR